MSDDRPSRAEQHLIDEARKHQARSPQPPGKVTVTRAGQFNGMVSSVHWRTQAWSPDGRQLAYGGADKNGHGVLHLWHPDSGHIESLTVRHLTHDLAGPVISLAWAPDGRHLAVADGERIIVWETGAGTVRWRLPWATSEGYRGPDAAITSIQWLDGGGYLLEFRPRGGAWQDDWGTTVATATVWDIEDGHCVIVELLSHEPGYREPPSGVAAGPDGRRLAVAVDFHPAIMWQLNGDLPHWVS